MVQLSLIDITSAASSTHADPRADIKQLEAVLAGDPAAERQFVLRYSPLIECQVRRYSVSRNARISEEDLQDIVGEVWVSMWENDKQRLRRFDASRGFKVSTWVHLLTRNATVDWLRARNARPPTAAELPPLELEAGAPLPSDALELREKAALAARVLERLSPGKRRFIHAWYVQGRGGEGLARDLGIAVATVYTRRFKIVTGLARLVAALE